MRSRRFPANTASDCLRFAKFRPQFSESCGATYIRICKMFGALQRTSSFVTDFENSVQIDSYLTTLSFLKLVRNWPKNAVLNLALCCGTIWRRRENRTIGAQLLSILYTSAQKRFLKKLLTVWLLVRTNLYIPSRFSTTNTKFNTCCQRYVATCGKKFIYVHIYSLGPKLLS